MTESEYQKRESIHKQLLDEMHDLYIRKNRDYGSSVTDTYEKFGLTSFLVRLSDKLNRVTNLTLNNKDNLVQDEKVQDTLMDLANYSILALIELKMDEDKLCQASDDYISYKNAEDYLADNHKGVYTEKGYNK